MFKIKSTLLALVAALAVAFGGLAVAAPAQAAPRTTVWFVAAEQSVSGLKIRVTGDGGTVHRLALGDRRSGVKRVCPPNSDTILTYRNPRGSGHALAAGQCTGVSLEGTYQFSLFEER